MEHRPMKPSHQPVIFAFWHSRGLPATFKYQRKNIHVLVSPSRDGEWLAQMVQKFGFGVVRGSTRQGPVGAVRQLVEVLQQGHDVAITPDGPLGPREQAHAGAVYVAKQSGCPIVPFSFDCSAKWTLNSWDRFIIPKPFSRGVFTWGNPIAVRPEATEEEMEMVRKTLEDRLRELTKAAANAVSQTPHPPLPLRGGG